MKCEYNKYNKCRRYPPKVFMRDTPKAKYPSFVSAYPDAKCNCGEFKKKDLDKEE